jgi:hypothetical protein
LIKNLRDYAHQLSQPGERDVVVSTQQVYFDATVHLVSERGWCRSGDVVMGAGGRPADDVDDGHYRTVRSANKRYALVIETDGRFVTRLRAGMVPAVEYVEGCN